MTHVTLTLETALAARLRRAAWTEGRRSVSSFAREAFAAYLTHGPQGHSAAPAAQAAAQEATPRGEKIALQVHGTQQGAESAPTQKQPPESAGQGSAPRRARNGPSGKRRKISQEMRSTTASPTPRPPASTPAKRREMGCQPVHPAPRHTRSPRKPTAQDPRASPRSSAA